MKMKKNILCLSALCMTLCFTACDKFDDSVPVDDRSIYESDAEATGTNTDIPSLKAKYHSTISASSSVRVDSALVFDGYVVANDISGNLYQTLVVRKGDDAIVVSINDNSLFAVYPVGTHVTVNLKGLYIGGYGQMAKIGQPYYTSSGNYRLGGMLSQLGKTNVKVIGFSNSVDELTPVTIDENWLNNADKDQWAPMLVHIDGAEIKGLIVNNERRPVYAMSDDEDAGHGVNDTVYVGNTKLIMRVSTLCSFAYDTIPEGKVSIDGVLTRYSSTWQIQFRDLNDVK